MFKESKERRQSRMLLSGCDTFGVCHRDRFYRVDWVFYELKEDMPVSCQLIIIFSFNTTMISAVDYTFYQQSSEAIYYCLNYAFFFINNLTAKETN